MLLRSSYGSYGANLPALMRAIVACGWFGINQRLDRRRGAAYVFRFEHSWLVPLAGKHPDRRLPTDAVAVILAVLGLNIFDDLPRHGSGAEAGKLRGAVCSLMAGILLAWAVQKQTVLGRSSTVRQR